MTRDQVRMPEHLTAKDLQSIAYVFSQMSLASKHAFLSGIILNHPEHYSNIIKNLGDNYTRCMVYA